MSAGNRKNMYRPSTEYYDNLRRQQKHEQNRHVWVFIITLLVFMGLMTYVGLRINVL